MDLKSFLDFIMEILRDPPKLLFVIVVAILATHSFNKITAIITARDPSIKNDIVGIECIVLFALVLISLHAAYTYSGNSDFFDRPFVVILILVVFALLSMVIYRGSAGSGSAGSGSI